MQTESTQKILNFGGLVTNTTPDKVPDRNATDVANIAFDLNGMIQTARGYYLYGNKVTEPGNCVDGFLYKKNFGTLLNIKLRTRDNGTNIKLEWFNPSNTSSSTDGYWELLKGSLTKSTYMGFAPANGDGGAKVNKLIMGNAVDPMMVWNGSTGTVSSATVNTIVINETIASEGFSTSTGKLMIGGTEFSYTGTSGSTFTGVTPNASSLVANQGVAQSVDSTIMTEHIYSATTIAFNNASPATITDSANGFVTAGFTVGQKISVTGSQDNSGVWTIANVAAGTITLATGEVLVSEGAGPKITLQAGSPKGNILLTTQRKLFIAGVKDNPSKFYYSQTGEVTAFGITTGLGSGGSVDLLEGGGPITCMEAKGKNTIVIHKKDTIIAYSRDNDGVNTIESFDTLADGFDNGAAFFKARTALNKTSFFMTGIEGAKLLEQAVETNVLSMSSITDIIMPTIKDYDNTTAVVSYFSPKRLLLIATNDKDNNRKQISIYVKGSSPNYVFDISIDDVPVADYIIDGKDIYFVSSLDQNTYKLFGRESANGNVLNHKYVTKEYTFESPAQQKEFDTIYCEGLINANTKLKVTVEYGIFGQDGSASYTIDQTNTDIVSTQTVSSLGTDVLGVTSLGGNDDEILDSYVFSFPLHVDINPNTRFKVKFETVYDEDTTVDHESYWAVLNCSVDARLSDISRLKMQNVNT